MSVAYENLTRHLDEHDVHYRTLRDDQSFRTDLFGEVGMYQLVASVDPDDGLFQMVGYMPIRIPVGARPSIAELIARANYSLRVGKFEMDCDDGELCFQTAQILTDNSLEDLVVERLMITTVAMLDAYMPAVLSVIYGADRPQDAIRCAEIGLFAEESSEQRDGD